MKRYSKLILCLYISTSITTLASENGLTRRASTVRIQIPSTPPPSHPPVNSIRMQQQTIVQVPDQQQLNSSTASKEKSSYSCTKVCMTISSILVLGAIGYTIWKQETIANELLNKIPDVTIPKILPDTILPSVSPLPPVELPTIINTSPIVSSLIDTSNSNSGLLETLISQDTLTSLSGTTQGPTTESSPTVLPPLSILP